MSTKEATSAVVDGSYPNSSCRSSQPVPNRINTTTFRETVDQTSPFGPHSGRKGYPVDRAGHSR
ncbi:hypothetical protein [Spirosoma rigui]|uniref:hypothetical protein n=1 Tax=Spirosoma rigui TaxID=564064 RepID=UPI0012D34FC1|nr:hypothetical protein [Spirosoma rigui]